MQTTLLRIRRYLRPNFSNHPLNWLSVIVVFLTAFFSSYSSASFNGPFFTNNHNDWFSTRSAHCASNYSGGYVRNFYGTYQCMTASGLVGFNYTSSNTFYCSTSPHILPCLENWPDPDAPSCPAAGTHAGSVAIYGNVPTASLNGCRITANKIDVHCETSNPLDPSQIGTAVHCHTIRGYVYTGEPSESTDEPLPDIDDGDFPDTEPVGVLPNTSDTTVDRQFETWPDGSTTETVVTSTTENRGAGQLRDETETTITTTYTSGITRTETTTETTITHADGSKTVTTEKTTTYTAAPITSVNITKPLGPVNESSSNPVSSSTTQTTTNTYDPDGNLTQSTSSGGSSEQGLGEEQSDYCTENPDAPTCLEWSPGGEGGNFDLDGYDAEIAEAKQNLTNMVADIKSDIETMFYFNGNGASLTCVDFINLPFLSISKQFCLSDYAGFLSVISKAILFVALFIAFVILMRR